MSEALALLLQTWAQIRWLVGVGIMKCLPGVLVLFGLFRFGYTIVCYECNSASNSFCAAAVLPDSLKRNCSEDNRGVTHTLCRKIVQHVDYGINGQLPSSRVIRTCGWDETKYKGVCYHRAGYGGRQEVCSCTKDLCNSSEVLTPSACLFTVVVVMIQKQLYE